MKYFSYYDYKKGALFFFLTLVFFLLFQSCEKECPDGFFGKDCEERISDQFTGSYEGYVNCGFQNEFASIEIYRKQGPFDVMLDFTSTPDFILEARVANDSIFIPDQWLGIPQGNDTAYFIIFESKGVLNGDTLRFPLTLLAAGISDPQKITCEYEVIK